MRLLNEPNALGPSVLLVIVPAPPRRRAGPGRSAVQLCKLARMKKKRLTFRIAVGRNHHRSEPLRQNGLHRTSKFGLQTFKRCTRTPGYRAVDDLPPHPGPHHKPPPESEGMLRPPSCALSKPGRATPGAESAPSDLSAPPHDREVKGAMSRKKRISSSPKAHSRSHLPCIAAIPLSAPPSNPVFLRFPSDA